MIIVFENTRNKEIMAIAELSVLVHAAGMFVLLSSMRNGQPSYPVKPVDF